MAIWIAGNKQPKAVWYGNRSIKQIFVGSKLVWPTDIQPTRFRSISLCRTHSAFVLSDGTVWTCGNNEHGQLGRVAASGTREAPNLGVIPNIPSVKSVSCSTDALGRGSTAILFDSGLAWSFGYSNSEEIAVDSVNKLVFTSLGRKSSSGSPEFSNMNEVLGMSRINRVWSGRGRLLVEQSGGAIYGLGLDYDSNRYTPAWIRLRDVSSLYLAAKELSFETQAICYQKESVLGTLGILDNNWWHPEGFSSSQLATLKPEQDHAFWNDAKQVSTGKSHAVAITTNGMVRSAGSDAYGQLAAGYQSREINPEHGFLISLPITPVKVVCGDNHTVFLLNDGRVMSAGKNDHGQLGRTIPVGNGHDWIYYSGEDRVSVEGWFGNLGFVPGLDDVTDIYAGGDTTMYIAGDDIYMSGDNEWGQLGVVTDHPIQNSEDRVSWRESWKGSRSTFETNFIGPVNLF